MRLAAAICGLLFWAGAGALLLTALQMDVSVPSGAADGSLFPGRVVNDSLMQQQSNLLQLGIGSAVIGAIFLATFLVVCAIGDLGDGET